MLFFITAQVPRWLQSQQHNFFLSTIAQHSSRKLTHFQAYPLTEAKTICLDGETTWRKRQIKNQFEFAPIFKMKLLIYMFIILSESTASNMQLQGIYTPRDSI